MSAPTADGGAAAIVCSEQFVNRHNLQVRYLVLTLYIVIFELKSFQKSWLLEILKIVFSKQSRDTASCHCYFEILFSKMPQSF